MQRLFQTNQRELCAPQVIAGHRFFAVESAGALKCSRGQLILLLGHIAHPEQVPGMRNWMSCREAQENSLGGGEIANPERGHTRRFERVFIAYRRRETQRGATDAQYC